VSPLTRQLSPALVFEPLIDSPLAVLCARGHPFANRNDVSISERLQEDILDLPSRWWDRDLFDDLVARGERNRDIHLEIDEWFGLLWMVHRGVGSVTAPSPVSMLSCSTSCPHRFATHPSGRSE
jgi:DNA-binding transcriptional LysR family regulator